ncbi:MAG: hypothetical protein PHU49_07465, partial [Syntrophorhabdaceae bacterium]|nr:hypothetical protein [Syntrophorhabdaceae bacterium]
IQIIFSANGGSNNCSMFYACPPVQWRRVQGSKLEPEKLKERGEREIVDAGMRISVDGGKDCSSGGGT